MPLPEVRPLAALIALSRRPWMPELVSGVRNRSFDSVSCRSEQAAQVGSLDLADYPVLNNPDILAGY